MICTSIKTGNPRSFKQGVRSSRNYFSLSGNGTKRLDTGWTNQGVVNWNDGDFQLNGSTFDNDLTFNILTADTNDIISGSGTFNNNATGTVNKTLGGEIEFQPGAGTNNAGLFDIDAGELEFQTASTTTATGVFDIDPTATLNFTAATHNVANPNAFVSAGPGAQLIIDGSATVNLNASTSLDPDIDLSLSTTLGGTGDLTVNGLFTWSSPGTTIVNIAGGLTTAATGTVSLSGNGTKRLDTGWTNQGVVNWNDGDFQLNGSTFDNDLTFNILTADINDIISGSGTFNNNATGTVNKTLGGEIEFQPGAGTNNAGLFDIDAGELEFQTASTTTATGVFDIDPTATLNFTAATHNVANPNAFVSAGPGAQLIIDGSATVNLNASTSLDPDIDLSLSTTLGGTGDLTVNGLFTWSSPGTTIVNIAGGLTTAATGTVSLSGNGTKRLDTGWTNQGVVNWNDGDFQLNGSTFDNDLTFNILTADINDIISGSGTFNNNATGTVNKTLGGEIEFQPGAGTNNAGLFDIDAGELEFQTASTTTATGVFDIDPTATLNFTAATHNVANPNAFVSAGPGAQLIIDGSATVNLNASTSLDPDIDLSLSTTLGGTGDLTVNGLFTWSSPGTTIVNIAGGLTTAATGTVSLSGNGTKRLDTGWTNQGVVNWNDGDFQLNGSTFDNDLTFNILTADTNDIISGSGTFNNNATGTVNKTLGGEIEFQPGAGTNNAGLFDIDAGELEFQTASTTTATGVFDIDPTATLNFTAATHNVANPNAFVSAGPGAQLIIDGSATVNLNASTSLDPDIDLSLSTTLGGTGDLTVNGLFTWSSPGTTIVNIAGGLTTAATGTVSLSGNGTKRLDTGWTNQGVVNWNDGDFQLNGSTFDNDLTFNILTADTNDIISGSGTFNNNATGTLSKLLTGLISVQNGGGFSNAGLVEIGDGTLNFTGIFTQTAGETRLDSGDLQANPTLNGGSLTGGGTVDGQLTVNNATVAPGLSADIIVVAGDLFLNAGSVTNIEIESTSGPGPGGHDQIQVNGTANLDGTLNVTLLGGFEPVGADNFTAIAAISGVVGTFATENAPAGKILTVDYNSNDVVLSGIIDNVFTIFWDNQTGNDLWTDPLNWDTDLLPVPADDVFIGIVDGQGVFITSGVQSISSVLSDEDIIINGGTLTIANSSQLNGNLTVGNSGASILNGAGDVTVAGLTVWSGNTSTIGGGGTLFADGGLDIAFGGGTSRNLDRTIEMSGTSTWTSTGGSNLNGSGQVVNQGTLNATNSATINVNTGFDNTVGTITKSAGAGELSFSGAFNNDNQVTIDAGTVALASTNTHTGGFTVNPGGTLRTTAGTSTMNGAAITGGGTVLGSGGTLVVNAGSLYNVGDTQLNGGTMTFNTRADTVTLTVGPSGASLLNGTGDVIVSGLTTWSGNTSRIEGSGTLVAGGGLDIDFGGGTSRTLERTVQMIGTSTWTSTGGSSLNGGGQVVNLGTLNATNSSTINVNAGFDNTTGTITKSAGVGELSFNGAFNNDNQVTVDAGTVNLSSTNAHTGVFTLNAGGTLRTSANTSTMTGATVSGAGSVVRGRC